MHPDRDFVRVSACISQLFVRIVVRVQERVESPPPRCLAVVSLVVGSGVSYFNIHSHVYLAQARRAAAAADRIRSRASQRAAKIGL